MRFGELDRFLVPLDAPAARRYFTDALYVPQGFRGRVRRALRWPGLKKSQLTGIEPLHSLLEEFPEAARGTSVLYLRDYATSDRGRVLAFFFEETGAAPVAIAKAQHARRGPESLETEAQALEQMRAFLPPALKPTLPRVLAFHTSRTGELLVTSAMRGHSGYVELQGSLAPWRNVDAHFDAAANWLAAFHDATRSSVSSAIAGRSVDHSACHGDFWVRNILIDEEGAPGIVDWEHFVPVASPFIDLFHYPLTYGINYPWRRYHRLRPEDAFRRTFIESNRVSRAVRRYLKVYAERARIAPDVMEQAFRQFVATEGRMLETVAPRPGTATLPWNAFASMWRAASMRLL